MAIKKITLTEDHLKLIENINFEKFNFDDKQKIEELRGYALSLELKPKKKKDEVTENDYYIEKIKDLEANERFGWGIDQWNMFGGTYVLEDVALILGKLDQAIQGTEEDPTGRHFPLELEDYMWDLYRYIYENMEYIISLVLYYSNKGGLTPGTYKCIDNIKNWEKIS